MQYFQEHAVKCISQIYLETLRETTSSVLVIIVEIRRLHAFFIFIINFIATKAIIISYLTRISMLHLFAWLT
jgi:hypothetical protein